MNEDSDLQTAVEQEERAAQQAADARRLEGIEERLAVVSGLSAMQRRFVIRYLFHGNATQAYKEAGYTGKNPRQSGSRLRHNPKIQVAIDEYFHQEEMSAREVIARLSQQARAEYAAYFDQKGRVDVARLVADGRGHLIKAIYNTKWGQRVEFYDAFSALAKVGEFHNLFRAGPTGAGDDPINVLIRYEDPDDHPA